METDIFYFLINQDVQDVAIQEIGRMLSQQELTVIKEKSAERINWYDAIAEAIADENIV